MGDFDLDLRAVEDHLDEEGDDDAVRIELGVLDGTTPDEEWIDAVIEEEHVLVLNVDGDVNELAAGFARDLKDQGGELVHFRGFLIIAPVGVTIDTDRL
ncbi:MAG: hypothetical protein ACI9YT_002903 [Halobacteriales archaeon]|jgi:hypothetical protein